MHCFAVARQAAVRCGAAARSCPAMLPARERSRRRLRRQLRPRRLPRGGLRRGRQADATAVRSRPVRAISRPRAAAPTAGPHGKAFVDFQNDVTAKDLRIAASEGLPLDRARQALHHDRHGDRSGQDLQPECAGDRCRHCCGRPVPEVGHTTFRMPYTPVTFGAWPARRAASCSSRCAARRSTTGPRPGRGVRGCRHLEARALLPARPAKTCTQPSRANAAPCATASACSMPPRWARSRWSGPDAAEFLNRIYTGSFARLAPGRCRYGVLLGEDGFVHG